MHREIGENAIFTYLMNQTPGEKLRHDVAKG